MSVNSRRKGAEFERQLAAWFRENLGTPARRGQQYSGSSDSPDIKDAIPGVHVEAKACEKLSLYQAMEQSIKDAGSLIPIVISKKKYKPALVTCRLEDLIALAVQVWMVLENGDGKDCAGSLAGHRPDQ